MCGICGIYNAESEEPVSGQLLERMTGSISHRGPDDSGSYIDGSLGLGFARLSIIDLSGGHQPMSNETGDVWLVFNGEIWNYKELRKELIEKGHQFRTNSDTETIVHAYEEYGVDCVARLNVWLCNLGCSPETFVTGTRPCREETSLLYPRAWQLPIWI